MKKASSSQTSTNDKNKQQSDKPSDNAIVIYCDGAGSSFDGKGSGFAWIRPQKNERHIERVDGLTNNQAEYLGLISALNSLTNGSFARIFTDSQLLCSQVNGNYKVRNTELYRAANPRSPGNKEEVIVNRSAMGSTSEEPGRKASLAGQRFWGPLT